MVMEVRISKRINHFSLNVGFQSKGLVTALFAPSGSGKTLTLSSIAGILKPDEGFIRVKKDVFFDSKNGIDVPLQRRKIGYVPQDYALFPNMSVFENISFGCSERERVHELLELFELKGLEDSYPSQLSGGQKQRVAFARALARSPSVLLLDEPFSAIHSNLKQELVDGVGKFSRMFNVPIVLVSHDIKEVFSISDSLVVMKDGRVKQIDTPLSVYFNPIDVETATILGHRSFVPGYVKDAGKFSIVKLFDGQILMVKKTSKFLNGEKVLVSVLSSAVSRIFNENRVKVFIEAVNNMKEFVNITGTIGKFRLSFRIKPFQLSQFSIEKGKTAEIPLNPNFLIPLPDV